MQWKEKTINICKLIVLFDLALDIKWNWFPLTCTVGFRGPRNVSRTCASGE